MEKILTFSFDDAVVQDRRLVALFNQYGVKGTFNIASGLLDDANLSLASDPLGGRHTISKNEVKNLYRGHEVAAHTLIHTFLPSLSDDEVVRSVEADRCALSALVGYEVVGMAYPCGGENYDDRVANLIENNTGIKYARTIKSTGSFTRGDSLYCYHPTIWQGKYEELYSLWEQFLATDSDQTQIFYVWGHSFEFDENGTWDQFEAFLKIASGREDVRYLTNKDAFGI